MWVVLACANKRRKWKRQKQLEISNLKQWVWVTCICLSLCISCQGSCVRVTKCVCVRVNTYTLALELNFSWSVYSFCCLLPVPGSLTASLTMSGNILYVPYFPFFGEKERTKNVNEVDGKRTDTVTSQIIAASESTNTHSHSLSMSVWLRSSVTRKYH